MKIKDIKILDLDLVPIVPLVVSYGSFDVLEYVLIVLTADDGTVGYGEAAIDTDVTGETRQGAKAALQSVSAEVVGSDPFDVESIMARAEKAAPSSPTAWAALDMALFDLMGKSLNIPVYRLLGGKTRDSIAFYPVIPLDEPKVMAGYADGFYRGGFREMKVKIGSIPEEDVERVRMISEAAPDARLILDVNQGWKEPSTAIDALDRIRDFPVRWVEQPTIASDLEALAEVRRHSPFPIMVDEGCLSPVDALMVVSLGAADIINIKLMKAGGLLRATKICAIAEAAGLPTIVGSMLESSLGSAAGMHLTAAKPGIIACEAIGPAFLKKDIATGFTVDFERRIIPVPEGPGMGVVMETVEALETENR
jgi:L-alanine-DL-glutamate epimerase-like enolase superfamily enzyme